MKPFSFIPLVYKETEMTQIRVEGYIVGCDIKHGECEWTVKLTTPTHPHEGKKFTVASFHPSMDHAKGGVNVSFRIEWINNDCEMKACDVRARTCTHPICDKCERESDLLFRLSRKIEGVHHTLSQLPACVSHCNEIGEALRAIAEKESAELQCKNIWRKHDCWRTW